MTATTNGGAPTKSEVRVLKKAFSEGGRLLGLPSAYRYEVESTEQHVHAAVLSVFGRHVVTVQIGEAFWAASTEERLDTLVHELLHVAMKPLRDAASTSVRAGSGESAADMAEDMQLRVEEWVVDALAASITPSLGRCPRWQGVIHLLGSLRATPVTTEETK